VKKNNNSKKIKGQGERERESCERKREELGKSRETKTNEKMKGPSTNEGLALALPTSSHNSSESSQHTTAAAPAMGSENKRQEVALFTVDVECRLSPDLSPETESQMRIEQS
jgi:hypothetical protein